MAFLLWCSGANVSYCLTLLYLRCHFVSYKRKSFHLLYPLIPALRVVGSAWVLWMQPFFLCVHALCIFSVPCSANLVCRIGRPLLDRDRWKVPWPGPLNGCSQDTTEIKGAKMAELLILLFCQTATHPCIFWLRLWAVMVDCYLCYVVVSRFVESNAWCLLFLI